MKNHNFVIAIGIIVCFFLLFSDVRTKNNVILEHEKELNDLRRFRDSVFLAKDSV